MSSTTTTTSSRRETERTKLIQEKCQTLLTQMLRDEDNKYCVDCDAKGPRWASWNLGIFLCIRCAGIHRNLGVHISRVKSVNLDTWTPEQVISLQQMGNSRARAVYEAQLPDGFRRPQTDTALESFIRAKYEHKKYLAREWVPPSPPKVDWAKEIDEELERQKRKKKAAQANSSLGIGVISGGGGGSDKKASSAKSAPLPAPLPKPKSGQSGSSPKQQRTSSNSAGGDSSHSNDLLGLVSPTRPVQGAEGVGGAVSDLQNDSFSCFLSASPANSLAKEEEDFFNQGSLGGSNGGNEKDKSGKLTKDSILALYGTGAGSGQAQMNILGQQQQQPPPSQPQPQPQHSMFGGGNAFTGMSPGSYMGAAGPTAQQPQFMTPPNSASMYNAPVMTAPAAFSAPGMSAGLHMNAGAVVGGVNAAFGTQYPMQSGFPQPALGGGIMATGQQGAHLNLMQTNQNLLMGPVGTPMSYIGLAAGMAPPSTPLHHSLGAVFQPAAASAASATSTTANMQQQFGNLNIGNVWQ